MDNQKAIEILNNYHNGYFGFKIDDVREAHQLAIKALEDRPQGEWNTHYVAFHLTCPFCGCNIRALKDMVFEGDYNYNYCPNCGAHMKGVKHDNRPR